MTQFSKVAIKVVEKKKRSNCQLDPAEEWDTIVNEVIQSQSSKKKGCPRAAFLGLCDSGCVLGFSAGNYTKSTDNKKYAIQAIILLRKNSALSACSSQGLWEKVLISLNMDKNKEHEGQMNIVLDLWNQGYIR